MGFQVQWVDLIMKCVSSVSYSIKVNGNFSPTFKPERGLRQGDPLSPYLFLLCAEGFSALLHKAEADGLISGVKVCPAAPSVSHLLFADDSLILIRATKEDTIQLQRILDLYEQCSGQVINKMKSAVLFSRNVGAVNKEEVRHILAVEKETMNEKYLGLPVYVGREKTKIFAYLKDRVWQRIQGWKEKSLSWAGKEIMIIAVAQAIPTFAMGCFDLTKTICDQISTLICRYWWNQQEGKHKIHWLSWEKMIQPKKMGGMGFRDIHVFNMAMLAKQGWRLAQNPESLCARVLKAKYFSNSSVIEAQPRQGMSYTWRSILRGIQALNLGVIWRLGDGESINIWRDPWLPRDYSRRPITPRGRSLVTQVADLINPITGAWDADLVKDMF